jgi:FkbM family methyltransferase
VTDYHTDQLERLLDVTSDQLAARADSLFERESGRAYPAPLVLCGAGRLGRVTLRGLRSLDIEPSAFADNNPRLHGERVDDCAVTSIDDAVKQHGADSVFITTVYTAQPLREQLIARGVRIASARALFFQHAATFLPHGSVDSPASIPSEASAIRLGLSRFVDDSSKAEYVAQIAWHTLAVTSVPRWTPAEQTYFPDFIRLTDDEVFVDCGAFDGDTIRAFLDRRQERFGQLIVFEPDPTNYARLQSFISGLPPSVGDRVTAHQVAAHSGLATLRFSSADGAGSAVAAGGDIEVRADSIDRLLASVRPTFIKMDIEGAEPNALQGARATLRTHSPTLAVCLYHARRHLWELPELIHQANPRYRIFLRRHSDESWETVAYALAGA